MDIIISIRSEQQQHHMLCTVDVSNVSYDLLLIAVFVMDNVSFTGSSLLISRNALECPHIGDDSGLHTICT